MLFTSHKRYGIIIKSLCSNKDKEDIMANKEYIANLATNDEFKNKVKRFYGEDKLEYQAERYRKIYDLHCSKYGNDGIFFSSPGRIEVCGNHTDHNNGKVLCASITVDTIACVTPSNDNKVIVDSVGFDPVCVDLDNLYIDSKEYGNSAALDRKSVV